MELFGGFVIFGDVEEFGKFLVFENGFRVVRVRGL